MATGDHGVVSQHVQEHVEEVSSSEHVHVIAQNLHMEDGSVLVMTKTEENVTKQNVQLTVVPLVDQLVAQRQAVVLMVIGVIGASLLSAQEVVVVGTR